MKYAIFDLDGCVSDDRHRRSYLEAKEYHNYHSTCERDEPFPISKSLVDHHANDPTIELVFLTARPYDYSNQTFQWIRDKLGLLQAEYRLMMRHSGCMLPSPQFKVGLLARHGIRPEEVAAAYDNRDDVLDAYHAYGIQWVYRLDENGREIHEKTKSGVAGLLREAAATVEARNAVYKDNWRNVPEVVKALFPEGVPSELVTRPEWHLFELMLVKMTRFVNADMRHRDSIHDLGIYAFMIESILKESSDER